MNINCISCGHKINIGDAYDEYEGPIKCFVCDTMLELKTIEGNIKSINFFTNAKHISLQHVDKNESLDGFQTCGSTKKEMQTQ